MKKELKEIEKNLKATLTGFKDAKEMYGYDLANETYYVKEALKQVKLLDLHSVSNTFDKYCKMCEEVTEHRIIHACQKCDKYL